MDIEFASAPSQSRGVWCVASCDTPDTVDNEVLVAETLRKLPALYRFALNCDVQNRMLFSFQRASTPSFALSSHTDPDFGQTIVVASPSLDAAEITVASIFLTQGDPHALGSVVPWIAEGFCGYAHQVWKAAHPEEKGSNNDQYGACRDITSYRLVDYAIASFGLQNFRLFCRAPVEASRSVQETLDAACSSFFHIDFDTLCLRAAEQQRRSVASSSEPTNDSKPARPPLSSPLAWMSLAFSELLWGHFRLRFVCGLVTQVLVAALNTALPYLMGLLVISFATDAQTNNDIERPFDSIALQCDELRMTISCTNASDALTAFTDFMPPFLSNSGIREEAIPLLAAVSCVAFVRVLVVYFLADVFSIDEVMVSSVLKSDLVELVLAVSVNKLPVISQHVEDANALAEDTARFVVHLLTLLGSCIHFALPLVFVLWLCAPLGGVVFCAVLLFLFAFVLLAHQASKLDASMSELSDSFSDLLGHHVRVHSNRSQVAPLASFLKGDRRRAQHTLLSLARRRASSRASLANTGEQALVLSASAVCVASLLLLLSEYLDLAGLVASIALCAYASSAAVRMMRAVFEAWGNLPRVSRLLELRSLARKHRSVEGVPLKDAASGLSARCMSFSYPTSPLPLFQALEFQLPEGKTIALFGQAHSGKSTLLRLLAGHTTPVSGSIRMDGIACPNLALTWAYLDQCLPPEGLAGDLIPGHSVLDNIGLRRGVSVRDVEPVANRLGMAATFATLPQGYDTVIDRGLGNVTAELHRSILLMRCFCMKSPFMFLDDPTSCVPCSEEVIASAASHAVEHDGCRNVIIATRSVSMAAKCDFVVVLTSGIAQMGPPAQLQVEIGPFRRAEDLKTSSRALENDASSASRYALVSSIWVFQNLEDHHRHSLSKIMMTKKLKAGSVLWDVGSPIDIVSVVVCGLLEERLTESPSSPLWSVYEPGDAVAASALVDKENHSTRCVAVHDTTLLQLSRHYFDQFLMLCPPVAKHVDECRERRAAGLQQLEKHWLFCELPSDALSALKGLFITRAWPMGTQLVDEPHMPCQHMMYLLAGALDVELHAEGSEGEHRLYTAGEFLGEHALVDSFRSSFNTVTVAQPDTYVMSVHARHWRLFCSAFPGFPSTLIPTVREALDVSGLYVSVWPLCVFNGRQILRLSPEFIPLVLECDSLLFDDTRPCDAMYVVVQGVLKVAREREEGEEIVRSVGTYSVGQCFGLPFENNIPNKDVTVVTDAKCVVLKLPWSRLSELSDYFDGFNVVGDATARVVDSVTALNIFPTGVWPSALTTGDFKAYPSFSKVGGTRLLKNTDTHLYAVMLGHVNYMATGSKNSGSTDGKHVVVFACPAVAARFPGVVAVASAVTTTRCVLLCVRCDAVQEGGEDNSDADAFYFECKSLVERRAEQEEEEKRISDSHKQTRRLAMEKASFVNPWRGGEGSYNEQRTRLVLAAYDTLSEINAVHTSLGLPHVEIDSLEDDGVDVVPILAHLEDQLDEVKAAQQVKRNRMEWLQNVLKRAIGQGSCSLEQAQMLLPAKSFTDSDCEGVIAETRRVQAEKKALTAEVFSQRAVLAELIEDLRLDRVPAAQLNPIDNWVLGPAKVLADRFEADAANPDADEGGSLLVDAASHGNSSSGRRGSIFPINADSSSKRRGSGSDGGGGGAKRRNSGSSSDEGGAAAAAAAAGGGDGNSRRGSMPQSPGARARRARRGKGRKASLKSVVDTSGLSELLAAGNPRRVVETLQARCLELYHQKVQILVTVSVLVRDIQERMDLIDVANAERKAFFEVKGKKKTGELVAFCQKEIERLDEEVQRALMEGLELPPDEPTQPRPEWLESEPSSPEPQDTVPAAVDSAITTAAAEADVPGSSVEHTRSGVFDVIVDHVDAIASPPPASAEAPPPPADVPSDNDAQLVFRAKNPPKEATAGGDGGGGGGGGGASSASPATQPSPTTATTTTAAAAAAAAASGVPAPLATGGATTTQPRLETGSDKPPPHSSSTPTSPRGAPKAAASTATAPPAARAPTTAAAAAAAAGTSKKAAAAPTPTPTTTTTTPSPSSAAAFTTRRPAPVKALRKSTTPNTLSPYDSPPTSSHPSPTSPTTAAAAAAKQRSPQRSPSQAATAGGSGKPSPSKTATAGGSGKPSPSKTATAGGSGKPSPSKTATAGGSGKRSPVPNKRSPAASPRAPTTSVSAAAAAAAAATPAASEPTAAAAAAVGRSAESPADAANATPAASEPAAAAAAAVGRSAESPADAAADAATGAPERSGAMEGSSDEPTGAAAGGPSGQEGSEGSSLVLLGVRAVDSQPDPTASFEPAAEEHAPALHHHAKPPKSGTKTPTTAAAVGKAAVPRSAIPSSSSRPGNTPPRGRPGGTTPPTTRPGGRTPPTHTTGVRRGREASPSASRPRSGGSTPPTHTAALGREASPSASRPESRESPARRASPGTTTPPNKPPTPRWV